MKNKYILERIIDYIEEHLKEKITLDILSKELHISNVYIKKLFFDAFHLPISHYIRKRKLSVSAYELLYKDYRIIDIALDYGFCHVQTYINAFKKEFGLTPYQWKLSQGPLTVTDKLSVDDFIQFLDGGIIFPEIILFPKMILTGKKYTLGFEESHVLAPKVALDFYDNDYHLIHHIKESNVYYGVTLNKDDQLQISDYYTTVHVSKANENYENIIIEQANYAKFTYIGNHSYKKLSVDTAKSMYQAIDDFIRNKYNDDLSKEVYFERVDLNRCIDDYCVMEWYIPFI